MKPGARIGIGVALGIAAISAFLARTKLRTGIAKVQESWMLHKGQGYTHGGHIPAPKGQEKVEVSELP
jgi:hypothetical protein